MEVSIRDPRLQLLLLLVGVAAAASLRSPPLLALVAVLGAAAMLAVRRVET